MYANQDVLKTISNETIDAASNLNVVTPSIYSSLFFKFASEHGLEINDEANIADNELNAKISLFTNLNNKTSNKI